MSSLIKDSSSSAGLGSATIPVRFLRSSVRTAFTRTDATYDIKQEYDIHLDHQWQRTCRIAMTTTTVPEPVTILSALIGLVPMGLMVRSLRRRKSAA